METAKEAKKSRENREKLCCVRAVAVFFKVISKLAQGKFKHVPFRRFFFLHWGRLFRQQQTTSSSWCNVELYWLITCFMNLQRACENYFLDSASWQQLVFCDDRQSKLTYLLTDALNGNSKTHMASGLSTVEPATKNRCAAGNKATDQWFQIKYIAHGIWGMVHDGSKLSWKLASDTSNTSNMWGFGRGWNRQSHETSQSTTPTPRVCRGSINPPWDMGGKLTSLLKNLLSPTGLQLTPILRDVYGCLIKDI